MPAFTSKQKQNPAFYRAAPVPQESLEVTAPERKAWYKGKRRRADGTPLR